MKSFSFALLVLASLSVAQFDGLPGCATDCASKFLANGIGNCGRDVKCICSNDSFIGDISCCLIDACDAADVSSAITFAHQICTAAGVSVPNEPNCSTTISSSGSKTSAVTTATSTVESGTMNIQTSTPTTGASTSAPTGSASQAGSSSATTGTTSNPGPRVTVGPVLGALGGLAAVVAML